jgi:hypothetical protein
MINLEQFINKDIFHGVCEVGIIGSIVALPAGTKFVGEISVSETFGVLTVYVPYIAESNKSLRNFNFKVVKGGGGFVLPHNYQYVGHALVPYDNGEGYDFINVYVEKEL